MNCSWSVTKIVMFDTSEAGCIVSVTVGANCSRAHTKTCRNHTAGRTYHCVAHDFQNGVCIQPTGMHQNASFNCPTLAQMWGAIGNAPRLQFQDLPTRLLVRGISDSFTGQCIFRQQGPSQSQSDFGVSDGTRCPPPSQPPTPSDPGIPEHVNRGVVLGVALPLSVVAVALVYWVRRRRTSEVAIPLRAPSSPRQQGSTMHLTWRSKSQ